MRDGKQTAPGAGGLIRVPEISKLLSDPTRNMEALVQHAFEGLRPNTLRAYEKAWDDFARYLGVEDRGRAAQELLKGTAGQANALVLGYRAHLLERKLGPSTVNVRLAALKSITDRLRIMGLHGWRLEVKGLRVKAYKDTRGPGKAAILSVIRKIEERRDPKARRDCAIIRLLYTTALRRGEVASLDLDDLDLEQDRIWLLGKGSLERVPVTVPAGTKDAIRRWVAARSSIASPSGPVFVSLDPGSKNERLSGNGIWKLVRRYGLGRPHGLRHSSVTEALAKTKDPAKVQQLSRHRDLRTLMIYNDNLKDAGGDVARLLDEEV